MPALGSPQSSVFRVRFRPTAAQRNDEIPPRDRWYGVKIVGNECVAHARRIVAKGSQCPDRPRLSTERRCNRSRRVRAPYRCNADESLVYVEQRATVIQFGNGVTAALDERNVLDNSPAGVRSFLAVAARSSFL